MNNKKLEFSILLDRIDIEELDFSIYVPTKPLIGYTLDKKDEYAFIDILSGKKYLNIDQSHHLGLPIGAIHGSSLSKVKETLKVKNIKYKKENLIMAAFRATENYVYYFTDEGRTFNAQARSDFEKQYGIIIDYPTIKEINELTDKLIDGNISIEDYIYNVYGEKPIESEKEKENVSFLEKIPLKLAYETIKESVIAQDDAVKSVLTSIYKSKVWSKDKLKSNIFLYGPTGVGKTEIVRSISKTFDIPVFIEDMTRYTETGYKGLDIDEILVNLYQNANGDLEKAENSIVFLDEIDKKASNDSRALDFNKGDVLKSLLKIVEGGVFNIEVNRNQTVMFDTSKLIVIIAGAYSDLFDAEQNTKTIGFNKTPSKINEDITTEKFVKYGIPREFIGRFSPIVRLNSLTIEDLIKILKGKNSILNTYKNIFEELYHIKINISEETYRNIAQYAYNLKTGARALKNIVNAMFENILFEIIDNIDNIESLELGENIVKDNKDYKLKLKR